MVTIIVHAAVVGVTIIVYLACMVTMIVHAALVVTMSDSPGVGKYDKPITSTDHLNYVPLSTFFILVSFNWNRSVLITRRQGWVNTCIIESGWVGRGAGCIFSVSVHCG